MNNIPGHSTEPEHTAEPEYPAEPEHIAQPEHVAEPEHIAVPEQVAEPEHIAQPEHVAEPEHIAQPEHLAEPENIAQPEHEAEPEYIAVPEHVSEPEYIVEPEHIAEPLHAVEPEHRAVPVHILELDNAPSFDNRTEKNSKPSSGGFFARIKSMNWLFILTVVVPTFLSVIYFGFIASDVYISESRFVVRSPERQTASPLGMLLKGTGFARSQDDSFTVQDFMLSRDALKSLNEKLGIEKAFASKDVDIFSRFAGLEWWDKSFEALYKYYQKKVDIQLDAQSSITTLTVRSFTADDSFRINQQLLAMSEALVNQLNELGRQDMIRFATGEVRNAEKAAKAAGLALSIYRNQKSVIDPERQSTLQFQQIAKLQDELLATQAQLMQLQTFAKNNPQIPSLQLRVKNLRQEIEAETDRVAGGDRSLAKKAAEYQRLALEREFADKQLGSTLVSLEQARNEAQRKQLYLERIVQPSKPDMAMEPRRARSILATFMLGMVVWGVLSMLFAGVREHQD